MLSGCAAAGLWRVDSAGSPVQSVQALQAVDLPTALNPGNLPAPDPLGDCIGSNAACTGIVVSSQPDLFGLLSFKSETTRDRSGAGGPVLERRRLEWALQAFYRTDPVKYGSAVDRRNRLQQRLITASDTNCGIFAENLYATQASTNAFFGTSATALGGAGSIVTGVGTARLLSGLSGIATGVRAELNEDYFRNLWVEAMIKAIETDRDQRRSDMATHAADSISQYPVEAAIADAIRYNSACSLVSGLKDVNQAVVIAADPAGLKAFHDTYSRAGFTSSFNMTVNSNGQSDRLAQPASTSAAASAALVELSSELATARVDHTAAVDALTNESSGATLTQAKADVEEAFGRIDLSNTTNLLKAYVDQLTALQASYAALTSTLGADDTAQKRSDTLEQMRANDASADVIRRAALELIHDTEGRMADIVTQNEPSGVPKVS